MTKANDNLQNFYKGAIGYSAGLAGGVLFLFLASKIGLVRWLVGLIDPSQPLVKILGAPVFAGFVLAIGGAIIGAVGGWYLASILGVTRKRRQVIGSGIAFGITFSALTIIYLVLLGLISVYNNFSTNRLDQFGLVFGFFGLVFGLLTGIIQSLLSLRLKHTWRLILASTLGFTLGGILMGLLVKLVNPTAGFQTYPILTWIVLFIAIALPFALGGGAMGWVYGKLNKRLLSESQPFDSVQPSAWQTGIVAVIGLVIVFRLFGIVGNVAEFLTINPGNLHDQLTSETVGVHWSEPLAGTDNLTLPELAVDESGKYSIESPDGNSYSVQCSPEGTVLYQPGSDSVQEIEFPHCDGTPVIALSQNGQPHIIWYATEIRDTNGQIRPASILVESILADSGWIDPAIATETSGPVQPYLSSDDKGNLLLAWNDPESGMHISNQQVYSCDDVTLNTVAQAGLDSIISNGTRQPGAVIPFCGNEFTRILYTPNPEPEFSSDPATPNSAFDRVSGSIITSAQYEVLFSTMQYEPSSSPPSPGNILATGVAELYQEVKAHPENYPRGMTVRILLGNYPVFSNLDWGSQIMDAISDFRAAGIDKMVDPEIGWKLEFANFPGTYPHSHTKFLVIDGKQVTGAGFNYGYLHFPKDHPSGKGYDLFDLGLAVSGPAAQDATSVYDDMWNGADQVYCENLAPTDGSDWQDTCTDIQAHADHVPEVLRYYLPADGKDKAFSLYRNSKIKESDDFISSALTASSESIDMMEVNFSMQVQCILNIIFPDFCTIDNSLPWMNSLIDSIENNGTYVRVIMENTNSAGLENRVAGDILLNELKRLGLEDHVELRFYDGKIHAKSMLMDGKLLVIGSQNFHYSAWGNRGLNEFNVATDNPDAIAEYQTLFEAKWKDAIPFEEADYGQSP